MNFWVGLAVGWFIGIFCGWSFSGPSGRETQARHRWVVKTHHGKLDPDGCMMCSEEEWP